MNNFIIKIHEEAGVFAENKDIARDIRINKIIPSLKNKKKVILDFEKVEATTQSFIHALISDVLRLYNIDVLDMIVFKSCNPTIREIITIVVNYMQESLDS